MPQQGAADQVRKLHLTSTPRLFLPRSSTPMSNALDSGILICIAAQCREHAIQNCNARTRHEFLALPQDQIDSEPHQCRTDKPGAVPRKQHPLDVIQSPFQGAHMLQSSCFQGQADQFLANLRELEDMVFDNPTMKLESNFKKFRQAAYKLKHKYRRRAAAKSRITTQQ